MAIKRLINSFQKILDNGGVLALGIGCWYLQREQYIPKVFRRISFGLITVGVIAVGRRIMYSTLFDNPGPSDEGSEEVSLSLLDEATPKLEKLQKLQKKLTRKTEILEGLISNVSQTVKELSSDELQEGQEYDIFSQTYIQELQKKMQLGPEELHMIEQYYKSFEEYLNTRNSEDDYLVKLNNSDMELSSEMEDGMIFGIE